MVPPKKQLEAFDGNLSKIADHYDVSERTARRWLGTYGLYRPTKNFGAYKLGLQEAREIRARHTNECISIKELAEEYNVTFATISRILHNQTYCEVNTAKISVTYNPKEV